MTGWGERAETAAGVVALAWRMAIGRLTLSRRTLDQRLADFPRFEAPVAERVSIRWNTHQVPMIEARHDHDAAVALGVVHGHLRLSQLEIMRRIVQGRVAEMLGPVAVPLDHALRILDLGRCVPDILRQMPASTRVWLQGFARGLNHLLDKMPEAPPDFRILGLRRERWTVADLVAVGRLACADPNWVIWFNLLRLEDHPDWPQLWRKLIAEDEATMRPLPGEAAGLIGAVATAATRAGSNAFAVAGWRTTSGNALMAADPHLNLLLPNLWLLAGVKSPSVHAVGMMLPGLPFMVLGRNPDIAWSGTSAQAAMSDFVDLDAAEPTEGRLVPIKSRWGRTRQMPCRDSQHGPVVSDSRLMARRRPTALRWMGHQPSDEFTAMLSLNKARDWQGFVAAVDRVAVPGQFMVYADARGRVGSAIAARLPQRRSDQALPGPTRATGDLGHWRATASARSLPLCVDPVDGVVASANEKPLDCPVTVSHFWPPRDRHRRMTESLTRRGKVDVAQVMAMQRDVFSEASRDFRDMLAPQLAALRLGARGEVLAMLDAIGRWDAHYDETSEGAAAFECLLYHFACALHGPDLSAYWATWDPLSLLRREAEAMGEQDFRRALAEAMGPAACAWRKHRRWGDMHRLMLGHALSFLPLVGRLFRFADLPVGGANQTLMKSAHGLAGGRHAAKFGAQARQVCDMSDPDANWFVLLGGQDGWMGSDTFLDQLDLWRKGEYVRMPLSPEAVADCYPLRTDLVPDRRR